MDRIGRILLAEDNERSVELTLASLEEMHLANDVLVVRDGEEALDYLYRRGKYSDRNGNQPAVVLLDIKMPKVDGLEVLRILKEDPSMKQIPVVILTSSNQEADVVTSYRYGANAYVTKPIRIEEFHNAIRNLGLFWAIVNEAPPGSEQRTDQFSR